LNIINAPSEAAPIALEAAPVASEAQAPAATPGQVLKIKAEVDSPPRIERSASTVIITSNADDYNDDDSGIAVSAIQKPSAPGLFCS